MAKNSGTISQGGISMYVVGTFEFKDGTVVKISDMEVINGNRPKGPQDIPDCDPEVLRTMDGTTRARVGAGCALVVDDITRLAWSSDRVMGNLRKKVPELFNANGELIAREGLVGLWRDGGAGGTFWCADVCAGVAEKTDIFAAALRESVEVGLYSMVGSSSGATHVPGYARLFPVARNDWYREMQGTLDHSAQEEWLRLLGTTYRDPYINLSGYNIPECRNVVDCHCTVATTEPESGSVEVVFPMSVGLPEVEGGWHVRDTEHMEVKGKYIALNRRPVLIVPIEGHSPVLLGLGPDGLDPHATIARLEGSNLDMIINSKVRTVLRALGWLPKS